MQRLKCQANLSKLTRTVFVETKTLSYIICPLRLAGLLQHLLDLHRTSLCKVGIHLALHMLCCVITPYAPWSNITYFFEVRPWAFGRTVLHGLYVTVAKEPNDQCTYKD